MRRNKNSVSTLLFPTNKSAADIASKLLKYMHITAVSKKSTEKETIGTAYGRKYHMNVEITQQKKKDMLFVKLAKS